MIERACALLPENISHLILSLPERVRESVCEIRLRKNAALSLSTYWKNIFVTPSGKASDRASEALCCSERDILTVISRLTDGSMYRYGDSLSRGFIVTRDGIRAGIAGEWSGVDGVTGSFYSVNLRLSTNVDAGFESLARLMSGEALESVLIVSPPGYGKTTAIRSVARSVALGRYAAARRVAVIDERAEIFPDGGAGLIDLFTHYPKQVGIERATRLFSPELIVCDEIGGMEDAEALLSVQSCGVPILATTHGRSFEEAVRRPVIKKLVDAKVFTRIAVIERGERGARMMVGEPIC